MESELFSQSGFTVNETLSTHATTKCAPLAVRMRPTQLSQFVGQEHILGQGKLLRRIILADRLQSAIFFGPCGCGKTTFDNANCRTAHVFCHKVLSRRRFSSQNKLSRVCG